MKAGDDVIYVPSPALYGHGIVDQVLTNGQLMVSFHDSREQFDPHELELVTDQKAAA